MLNKTMRRVAVIGTAFGLVLAPHAANADPATNADGFKANVSLRYQQCYEYVTGPEFQSSEKAQKYGIKDCDKQQKYALKDFDEVVKTYEKEGTKNPLLLDLSMYVSKLDELEQAYHDCIQQDLRGKLEKPDKYDRKDLDKGRKYGAHYIRYSIKGKYDLSMPMNPVPGTTETCETDGVNSLPDELLPPS